MKLKIWFKDRGRLGLGQYRVRVEVRQAVVMVMVSLQEIIIYVHIISQNDGNVTCVRVCV